MCNLVSVSLDTSLSELYSGFQLVVGDGVIAEDKEVVLLITFAHLVLHVPIVFAG